MSETKQANTLTGKHLHLGEDGQERVGSDEYMWDIPKPLRGTFYVGDRVLVKSSRRLQPIIVTDIFRKEYQEGERRHKKVNRVLAIRIDNKKEFN